MVSSYITAAARCPFYLWDNGSKLRCEGFLPHTAITIHFSSSKYPASALFSEHTEKYCRDQYQDCPVYKLIMEQKYQEDV